MPAFTTIVNALVAVGAKPFATTLQALRDNPVAIAEGDPTAPVVAAGWHPYNKTINNDANTGRIWSFAVDGAVAVITTPDFADGWDYALLFDRVSNGAGTAALRVNMFRETGGAYAGAVVTGSNGPGTSAGVTGLMELMNVRLNRTSHFISGAFSPHVVSDGTITAQTNLTGGASHATAQKILRAQLSYATGNITGVTGAAIYMLRRRNVAT
jgi:hypothetical protein